MGSEVLNSRVCPACHNLEYQLFNAQPRTGTRFSVRYKFVQKDDLEAAACNGCHLCRIIAAGVSFFWGQLEPNSSEDDSSSPSDDSESDEASERRSSRLCIERRPGRSLAVFRDDTENDYCPTEMRTKLEFYVQNGEQKSSLHPAFGQAGQVLGHLDEAVAADLINKWMQGCTSHQGCSDAPKYFPTRVLDVSTEPPKLVELNDEDDQQRHEFYVTVSHCWGTEASITPMRTTRGTLQERKVGIPWRNLPPLFQDIVALVRLLGYRYLWVDSLCIIQDDKDDWAKQSLMMANVYSHAQLNISATSSRNCFEHLYKSRQRLGLDAPEPLSHKISMADLSLADIYTRFLHENGHLYILGESINGRFREYPLLERAWVLQETLLSRRTVHFTASEMIWQCRESMHCECKDLDNLWQPKELIPRIAKDTFWGNKELWDICNTPTPTKAVYDFWLKVVNIYSHLDLTEESDRPFALTGIAQQVRNRIHDDYLAGIWKQDLPRALLWRGAPRQDPKAARLHGGIPSWSWMSRNSGRGYCQVWYDFTNEKLDVDSRARVFSEGTFCTTTKNDGFGSIQHGQVELEAASWPAVVEADIVDDRPELVIKFGNGLPDLFWADCPSEWIGPAHRNDSEVLCLLIGRTYCDRDESEAYILVLKALAGRSGFYRRVGLVATQNPILLFDTAPVLRVKVI